LLLQGDVNTAIDMHLKAKALDPSVIPPLAQLHLQGNACGGLGDVYYVMAVITKQLVDSKLTATDMAARINNEGEGAYVLFPNITEASEPQATSKNARDTARDKARDQAGDNAANTIGTYYYYQRTMLVSSLSNLLTLCADSGLHGSAEAVYAHLVALDPLNTAVRIRGALLTPDVFENSKHINDTRVRLQTRLDYLTSACCGGDGDMDHQHHQLPLLKTLDEFVLSPTFYYVYQGFPTDQHVLAQLHQVYAAAHPKLSIVHPAVNPIMHRTTTDVAIDTHRPPIRIGFASSHFRRHSICKLFCGIITGLAEYKHPTTAEHMFQVFVFSSLQETREDDTTRKFMQSSKNLFYVRSGMTVVGNREEVHSTHCCIHRTRVNQPECVCVCVCALLCSGYESQDRCAGLFGCRYGAQYRGVGQCAARTDSDLCVGSPHHDGTPTHGLLHVVSAVS
jgi:hypothetical protein